MRQQGGAARVLDRCFQIDERTTSSIPMTAFAVFLCKGLQFLVEDFLNLSLKHGVILRLNSLKTCGGQHQKKPETQTCQYAWRKNALTAFGQ